MDVNFCLFLFLFVFFICPREWVYVDIWIPFLDYLFRSCHFVQCVLGVVGF